MPESKEFDSHQDQGDPKELSPEIVCVACDKYNENAKKDGDRWFGCTFEVDGENPRALNIFDKNGKVGQVVIGEREGDRDEFYEAEKK